MSDWNSGCLCFNIRFPAQEASYASIKKIIPVHQKGKQQTKYLYLNTSNWYKNVPVEEIYDNLIFLKFQKIATGASIFFLIKNKFHTNIFNKKKIRKIIYAYSTCIPQVEFYVHEKKQKIIFDLHMRYIYNPHKDLHYM